MTNPFCLIVGHIDKIKNYHAAATDAGYIPIITDSMKLLSEINTESSQSVPMIKQIELLILPGGGDISPLILNEDENAGRDIDEALDYVQLAYFQYFKEHQKTIVGICKGMQLINAALGGTLIQDMSVDRLLLHESQNGCDNHHSCNYEIPKDLPLWNHVFCENKPDLINSAHHQCIRNLANDLIPFMHASDGTIEGFVHKTLPIIGLQWHPERLPSSTNNYLTIYLSKIHNLLHKSQE